MQAVTIVPNLYFLTLLMSPQHVGYRPKQGRVQDKIVEGGGGGGVTRSLVCLDRVNRPGERNRWIFFLCFLLEIN